MKNAALGGALFLTVYLIYKRSLNIVLEAPDGLDSEEVETIQRELDQEKKWYAFEHASITFARMCAYIYLCVCVCLCVHVCVREREGRCLCG